LAGTIDFVSFDLNDRSFTLIDWKRTSKNVLQNKKYCMQLNLYKYLFQKQYQVDCEIKMFIVQFHPDLLTYKLTAIPDRQQELIANVLIKRRRWRINFEAMKIAIHFIAKLRRKVKCNDLLLLQVMESHEEILAGQKSYFMRELARCWLVLTDGMAFIRSAFSY